ncbi:MAG: hypothetical protein D3918_14140 [Candidatus Electrothrix sp. AX2]|nr:hypothetical protein [Candidatus Electrothrix gigas]
MNVKKILYSDLKNIRSIENGDELIPVNHYDSTIRYGYEYFTKPDAFGDDILTRKTIAKKLACVNEQLRKTRKNFVLKVTYGFRPLSLQKEYFESVKERLSFDNNVTHSQILEEVHKYIAVPFTAGHPAGAAVDVTIFDLDSHKTLDMGSGVNNIEESELMY